MLHAPRTPLLPNATYRARRVQVSPHANPAYMQITYRTSTMSGGTRLRTEVVPASEVLTDSRTPV